MLTRFKTEVVINQDLERQYQEAALQVMKKYDVQVDDLYALLKPRRSEFQRDNDVHFSGGANVLMAKQVADCILQNLGRATEKHAPDPRQQPATPAATKSLQALQADFLKLKFGMFLHYNMATYTGEQWVKGYPDPSTFNPGGPVDTDGWADAAKSAGMKYAILTVKHVAGFCLWDSKYTTYDVMNPRCPYQQDLVAQFIKSFKSRGLKVGLYYHWRHPGFGDPNKHKVLAPECDPATHSQEEQKQFQLKQIAELLEKYPDCFYFWNDAYDPQIGTAEEVLTLERSIRPNILASSNWWNWGKKGTPYLDIAVKELSHFPEGNQAPGETCFSLAGRKWFWDSAIRGYGSAQDVLGKLQTANSRNSNLLLNVPPNRQGKLDEAAVKVLAEVGKLLNPDAAGK
jgi:alpha-L-fucosidase